LLICIEIRQLAARLFELKHLSQFVQRDTVEVERASESHNYWRDHWHFTRWCTWRCSQLSR